MAYILPQALVYQEFNLLPAEITNPLRACIFGGHADLHRHAEADEKVNIDLGDYVTDLATNYLWPDKAAGSVVDVGYVKVFIDDAYLKFFEDLTTGDSTITVVAGSNSKIASDTVKFVDNGAAHARTAALLRDVKKGDRVYLRGTSTLAATVGEEFELNTYVKGFEADQVAGTFDAGAEDASNLQDAGSTSAVVADAANTNADTVLTVTDTNWDILESGLQSDTYTVEITTSSTGGDFTSAKMKIVSASGDDDVANASVGADTVATEYGARDLNLTFTAVAAEDLIAGDKYVVTMAPAHAEANAHTSGAYTGAADATYIVTCTEGGAYGDCKVTVTTDNNSDASGPVVVTGDNVGGDAVTFAIGTNGVIIGFDTDSATGTGLGLALGDVWYVVVTAAADGDFHTIVLGHSMAADLSSATDLDLKLFIKKDIEVPQNIDGSAPSVNWETEATQIVINSGIQAFDANWVDSSGDVVALDVERGTVFAEYREWLIDHVSAISSLQDTAEIAQLKGPLDPDNPLKWGVFKALSNSNGTRVKFIAVADPNDDDDWADSLEKAVGRDDVYGLVPLTHDKTVLDLFEGHVNSQSSATAGRWRVTWVVADADDDVGLVRASTSSDSATVKATIVDNAAASGTQYTYLSITSANADIEDLGVKAGDVVRFLFSDDGFGNETYTEFVIDAVINETDVVLATAHSQAVGTAQRVEIWHTRTMDELAAAIATNAGAWGNRRVRAVWPDLINSGGELTDGMFLAAALSGLSSAVVPHQGLTNVQVSGFDDAERSRDKFNGDQLNDMADSGVWIVTQDDDGNILSRHALTSDNTDLNSQEEMVTRNVDSMSFLFLNRLAPYIGRANVTPSALDIISVEITACISFLKANGYTDTLGSQLIDGEISQLRQHALLKDRIVAVLDLEIPYPLNNIEVHLVV